MRSVVGNVRHMHWRKAELLRYVMEDASESVLPCKLAINALSAVLNQHLSTLQHIYLAVGIL
eukprot:1161722-Pelagomonas_calceolata.AAC.4